MFKILLRPACAEDIPQLIELLSLATYGFIEHVYASFLEPGADVSAVLAARLMDPTSQLSMTKARVAEARGQIVGFIMCETLSDPVDLLTDDTPDLLRPLFELESLAPGTTLINFVAAYPKMRGLGIGSKLMAWAESSPGPNGMCLTIHDQNHGARKLYESLGFAEVARRPIVKLGWDIPATEWVLMIKPRNLCGAG